MAQRRALTLLAIVDGLLDVSRITTRKLALKPESCEVLDVMRSAVGTARPLIVVRGLRQMPQTATCKRVAVTGSDQEDDRRRSQEAGFGTHLVKPVEPQQIIDIVDATALTRATV